MLRPTALLPLEHDVLTKFLEGPDPLFEPLRAQLRHATVSTRELTGVGFFTTLLIPEHAISADLPERCILDDVVADIDGLEHGAGFVLFVISGRLETLEGFSYDERWPDNIGRYRLAHLGEPGRDFSRCLLRTRARTESNEAANDGRT